jgi:lipopolysaccharide export system protein LptA
MRASLILRVALALLAGMLCAGVLAGKPPPQITVPAAQGRNYTLVSQSLLIRPGPQTTYLRFSKGVCVKGRDFTLNADIVELDIAAGEMTGGKAFKLPRIKDAGERVVQDPGQVTSEMAHALKIPDARFSAGSLKRVAAAGNVRVVAQGMTLGAGGLVSKDGGRSWAAVGRCELQRTDPVSREKYKLAADDVVYDTKTQRALAKGQVRGRFQSRDGQATELVADLCELDLAQGAASASGSLSVIYGALTLTCGALTADLKQQHITARDKPHLADSKYGLALDADGLSVDLSAQTITAQGGIVLHDSKRGVDLTAGKVTAELKTKQFVATGKPLVTYGGSTFSGEKIVVRQEEGKTVVEVEGDQKARIDLDEVKELSKDKSGQAP